MEFPSRVKLAQLPTPLQPLHRLHNEIGGPLIWIKRDDMTGSTLSGNKVRKLEFIMAKAQQEGCAAVITCGGIQSNHCRATAIAAAQLGMSCHLILRGDKPAQTPEGNLLLDSVAGASISYHTPNEYSNSLDSIFSHYQEIFKHRDIKSLAIPIGGSDGLGIWGYLAAFEEL